MINKKFNRNWKTPRSLGQIKEDISALLDGFELNIMNLKILKEKDHSKSLITFDISIQSMVIPIRVQCDIYDTTKENLRRTFLILRSCRDYIRFIRSANKEVTAPQIILLFTPFISSISTSNANTLTSSAFSRLSPSNPKLLS